MVTNLHVKGIGQHIVGQETQRPHDVAARETSITFVVLRAKTGPLGFVYQFLSASGRPASPGPLGPAPRSRRPDSVGNPNLSPSSALRRSVRAALPKP